jgi:phosphatidate cytidylyltransferase
MLKQRIITAVILAPIAIGCVFFLPPLEFSIFVAIVLTIAAWEWANLAGYEGPSRYIYAGAIAIALAATTLIPALPILVIGMAWWVVALVLVVRYPEATSLWSTRWARTILGALMLLPGFTGLVVLKESADSTFLILLLFLLIWGADVGAYFSGKAFGDKKLAPRVSPGKSWAGFYGGLATAMIIAVAMSLWAGAPILNSSRGILFLVACAFVVVTSVLGDLAVSMFKRHRGIKDSSNLLPGHGGFLDRIDSLLSAGPVFSLFILLYGWG